MVTRPTLLCAAEPWGFGPSSKLFAILRSMSPAPRIVAAGTGSATIFARLNADVVDDYIELDSPYQILSLCERFDAVLSVMDPWAALLGARKGVPVVYVDSLFWFWQWEKLDFAALPAIADEWLAASPDELRLETSRPVNWHVMAALACHWSTRVFAQRAAESTQRAGLFPKDLVRVVGAVVATRSQQATCSSSAPLVSISGAISHLTPYSVASRYAGIVRRTLSRAAEPVAEATITGNPALLPLFSGSRWRVRAMGPDVFQQAARAASVLLAPAGLTTAMEAAALGTPVIFLPEQHAGHAANVDVLAAADPGAYDHILLRRWFELSHTEPAAAIAELDECYRKILSGKAEQVLAEMASCMSRAVESMSEPRSRACKLERQKRNVLSVVGDFDGAPAIAAYLGDLLSARPR